MTVAVSKCPTCGEDIFAAKDRTKPECPRCSLISNDQQRIRAAQEGELVPVSRAFVEAGFPMPIEIKPGPELDRAVAAAVGWHRGTHDMVARFYWYSESGMAQWRVEQFFPSINLSAAFAAAEEVGLFDRDNPDDHTSLVKDDGLWHVQCCRWHESASTPALAICAAILKLKESSNVT